MHNTCRLCTSDPICPRFCTRRKEGSPRQINHLPGPVHPAEVGWPSVTSLSEIPIYFCRAFTLLKLSL